MCIFSFQANSTEITIDLGKVGISNFTLSVLWLSCIYRCSIREPTRCPWRRAGYSTRRPSSTAAAATEPRSALGS